jgi:hypothetical protein
MPSVVEATKPYLEYLEKEMTIQAVLAAFCILAVAGVLDRVFSAEKTSTFVTIIRSSWGLPYFIATVGSLVGSAWLFYLQRSELARVYGDLSRATTRTALEIAIPSDSYTLQAAIDQGDTFALWHRYHWGLMFLGIAAVEAVSTLITAAYQPVLLVTWPWRIPVFVIPPFLIGPILLFAWRACNESNRSRTPGSTQSGQGQ